MMDGFVTLRRRFLEALFLGLVATGACYLPPLHLAARLDGSLYDLWTQIRPPQPSADILLIRLDDPAWFGALAELARHWQAKLLITTLPQPPFASATQGAIGPVEIPVGESRLRRTDWAQGGHLWFRPDVDGVIRHDWPLIDEGEASPSLAFYAATLLAPGAGVDPEVGADAAGRRWLRFYPAHSFTELSPADLIAEPERVKGKVLIAGRTTAQYLTPIGALTGRELLAQALSGYRQNQRIAAGSLGPVVVWSATLLMLSMLTLRPLASRSAWWWFSGSATLGVLICSATAFAFGSLWLPIAGAAILLLTTGGIAALRALDGAHPSEPQALELTKARRLAANGCLEEAWRSYRQISATPALLGELYDLANALDAAGLKPQATDLFHRIAQVDGHFRDVGQRLVRSNQPATMPSSANPPDRDRMPKTLGRYELLEPIGRGAMGNVYLGRDPKINRIVAIKTIDLAAEFDPADLQAASRLFLREAETAGRLSHPNIVTIFDVGEADGLAYIAMEYLRGQHLSEFAAPDALLPVTTVLSLLSRTADALDYAHAENVVHRDIKPANIMYDSVSDGLKLTDFGIARSIDASRTRTGIILGTPAFMSPEQLEGKNVNGHTDLFALGVSLYQLLTGHLPFRGASMTKLMFVIANEPHQSVTAVRTDLPDCLNSIVDRALAKDPTGRFQTGAEMAAALRYGAAQIG